jgi:hypothetical protein
MAHAASLRAAVRPEIMARIHAEAIDPNSTGAVDMEPSELYGLTTADLPDELMAHLATWQSDEMARGTPDGMDFIAWLRETGQEGFVEAQAWLDFDAEKTGASYPFAVALVRLIPEAANAIALQPGERIVALEPEIDQVECRGGFTVVVPSNRLDVAYERLCQITDVVLEIVGQRFTVRGIVEARNVPGRPSFPHRLA